MSRSGKIRIGGGRTVRRFIEPGKPVRDGTVRCMGCGQIDEPSCHDNALCPLTSGPNQLIATYTTLRAANAARQAEWDPGKQISLSYRGNEMGGECGEAQNVIKKLERERLGIRGSRATVADLGSELADVVICADLIALAEGIDLDQAVADKFNATSEKVGLSVRLAGPEAAITANFIASQDQVGARYGLTTSPDRSSIPHCRAWFSDLSDARTIAEANGMTIWDLVEGRVVVAE